MQQTPSAQKPLKQSLDSVQLAPVAALLTQTPFTQAAVETQFASLAQLVGQVALVPLHAYEPQLGFAPMPPAESTVHVPLEPARSQRSQPPAQAPLQQTPSTQLPDSH